MRYEIGNYLLRDERSANGTFVNGQQIEEMVPRVLEEGDHVGIGEHELLFRTYGSTSNGHGVEDLPTIAVSPAPEMTYRTREDAMATMATSDQFGTSVMENGSAQADGQQVEEAQPQEQPAPATNSPAMPEAPVAAQSMPVATSYTAPATTSNVQEEAPVASTPPPVANTPPVVSTPPTQSVTTGAPSSTQSVATSAPSSTAATQAPTTTGTDSDGKVTFSRLTSISQPSLPDMTALMAALSTLDGQVMSLQEQINATHDAMHNHDAEIAQTTNQLRVGVRRVADRMDNTIADVARSREALAWADLSQLMEDVMNNPRDIEYVTKLARKARELNKIFQIHQNVLNTMYECNSLLRSLIGEER